MDATLGYNIESMFNSQPRPGPEVSHPAAEVVVEMNNKTFEIKLTLI